MLKRFFKHDWRTFFCRLLDMKNRSNRSIVSLLFDIKNEIKNHGINHLEYYLFRFDCNTDDSVRRTYISLFGDSKRIYDMFSNDEEYKYIVNKKYFVKEFSNFLGRDVLDIEENSFEDFEEFTTKHKIVFAKIPDSFAGAGVKKIDTSLYKKNELFKNLINDGYTLIEEPIEQHPDMLKLSIKSVPTLRVCTGIDLKGNVHILNMTLRINNDRDVCSGRPWTLLSDDGVITKPMVSKSPLFEIIKINPVTNKKYIGFKVPMINEAKKMAKDVASSHKNLLYVGWDVAISKNGPVLIEANDYPATYLFQMPEHLDNKEGKVKLYEEVLGIKLR